jgi:acetate kinase
VEVLTVNVGSTSTKVVTVTGKAAARAWADLDEALTGPRPDAVAHRVVHGGDRAGPVVLDDELVRELERLSELAPLHQPPGLAAIARCRATWPDVPQVAAFDTSFHATIPDAARTYALPARHRAEVRAYGFHGLSYEWAVGRVAEHLPGARRVVLAHLGGGQSLCAVRDGRSAMTTMGFTPLDGLVMATRPGSLDPGAVLWLAHHHPEEDLQHVLEHESGLLGVGGSGDLRELRRRATSGDAAAQLALDVWAHRLVAAAGTAVATLGGLDALVFTGGIGEHDAAARTALTDGLHWLGVATEDDGTAPGPDGLADLSAPGAPVRTLVVQSREDLQLAAHARRLLGTG